MQALFIGHPYIDVTFLTDNMPTGDEKKLGDGYEVGIGGNSVVAGFAMAKWKKDTTIMMPLAKDWLGRMMQDMANSYGINLITREVERSSLSLILPNEDKRAIVRCRDNDYQSNFDEVDLTGCEVIHFDGHQPNNTLKYAEKAFKAGILTSLDGGTVRDNTDEVLPFIKVAMVSEDFCRKLGKDADGTIDYLKTFGVEVAGVTLGSKGLVFEENGNRIRIPAIPLDKSKVIDSTGAGDIFHGAYCYSFLAHKDWSWTEHFTYASCASTLAIQKMGAAASIPEIAEVDKLYAQQ